MIPRGAQWIQRMRGAGILAAAYVYFLLFAEFGFLELAQVSSGNTPRARLIVTLLGVGGITGSLLAAGVLKRLSSGALPLAFLSCAGAAACALLQTEMAWKIAAGWIGLSVGWMTVTIATRLEEWIGQRSLGWYCGIGTGAAYLLCNMPNIFKASAQQQTVIAVLVAVAGAALGFGKSHCEPDAFSFRPVPDARKLIFIFTGLVWLDASAFYIIQHTEIIKAITWSTQLSLYANAITHLVFAMLAGWLLDRGYLKSVTVTATLLLVIACESLHARAGSGPLIAALYTGGVSLYSTALVWYPARFRSPWFSAWLYSVAGWIGSAVGIGMVQNVHAIPLLVPLVLAILLGSLHLSRWNRIAIAPLALAVLAGGASRGRANSPEPQVLVGRQVYISEGCIYCHSQFLRTRVPSEMEQWGPARASNSSLHEYPPLFGNRRQGPDLSTVGDRRSPEWQKLHLKMPSSFNPRTRMPSYGYLFGANDSRGADLVAYLESLSSDEPSQRENQIASWVPAPLKPVDAVESKRLFTDLCTICHGSDGRGDGELASQLTDRPPDFQADRWRHITGGPDKIASSIARIVKFGITGTSMPGHEYLADEQVLGLASYVESLHQTNRACENSRR